MLCLEKLLGLLLKGQWKSDAYKEGPWKSQRYTVTGNRYSGEGVCWIILWDLTPTFQSFIAILESLRYFSFQVLETRGGKNGSTC